MNATLSDIVYSDRFYRKYLPVTGVVPLDEGSPTFGFDGEMGARPLRVPRHDHVYNCGERDQSLYAVVSGQVKAVTYTRSGKSCLLSIYGPGDVFGELCLIEPERTETATAMTPTVLRRLHASKLLSVLSAGGGLEQFIQYLVSRLAERQQMITDLVTMNSEQRLARILQLLGRKLGRSYQGHLCIDDRITQEELSGMVGTTRSRVGFFLKGFADAGLIERDCGSFLAINEQRLANYLDSL